MVISNESIELTLGGIKYEVLHTSYDFFQKQTIKVVLLRTSKG